MGRAVERAWACKWGVWSREESGLAPSGSGVETGWDGGAFPRDGDHGKGPCFEEILSFPLMFKHRPVGMQISRPGTQGRDLGLGY